MKPIGNILRNKLAPLCVATALDNRGHRFESTTHNLASCTQSVASDTCLMLQLFRYSVILADNLYTCGRTESFQVVKTGRVEPYLASML